MQIVIARGNYNRADPGGNLIKNVTRFHIRVRTGPEKPGKSWNFIISFSRPGKSWNLGLGPGNSWKVMENQQAFYEWKAM